MSLDKLKSAVATLLDAVVTDARQTDTKIQRLRGVALYDPTKDNFISSRKEFTAVKTQLANVPEVQEKFGQDKETRIALQFVYEYFSRSNQIRLSRSALNGLWDDFVAEIESLVWTTRAVTNLRYFHTDAFPIDLGDGVYVYGRDPAQLKKLGFNKHILQFLIDDWFGFGASSFVLVAESTLPKTPDNFLMGDSNSGWLSCQRALGAMRLIAPGDVGMSRLMFSRIARFNVGLGGITSTGATIDNMGMQYSWDAAQHSNYAAAYTALAHLEKAGYGKAPGNLDLALRAFMSTYDRYPIRGDTTLVDAITALEAVLGTEAEISFKLSFRVASLLSESDNERTALLKTMKGFYDTRSRIVHGGRLTPKNQAILEKVNDLRAVVRRLLLAFVSFAADETKTVPKNFFKESLDGVLLDSIEREKLRQLLSLAAA